MSHDFRKSARLQVEVLERREQPNDMFGLGGALTLGLDSGFTPREPLPELEGIVSEQSMAPVADLAAGRSQGQVGGVNLGTSAPAPLAGNTYELDQAAAPINLRLIAMTGFGPSSPQTEFTPPPSEIGTQQWSFKTPDPAGAYAQASCEYGNDKQLYVAGGLDAAGGRTAAFRRWNPATDTWAALAPVPVPAGVGISNYDAMVVVGSKIYMFGGVNVAGATVNVFNNTFIYDIPTNTWSAGAPMPGPRFGSAVGWDGSNTIYVMGGASTIIETNTWAYSIAGNSWTVKTPMPTAAYRMHGAIDTILGGLHTYGNGFNSPEHRVYNYFADTHSTAAPVPVGITDPGTASIPGLGIIQAVFGAGTDGSGPMQTHVYDTFTPSWVGSFPGNPGGNVSNTCAAIYFNAADPPGNAGLVSVVGGYNGTTTVNHNQFAAFL